MIDFTILTHEQQSLVKDCYHWFYYENNLVFEFAGGPGTGKSFVLDFIINYLGICRDQIAPMAYTGAAAVNMRTKGLLNAGTIHSWIYHTSIGTKLDRSGNPLIDDYFNRPKETLDFIPKVKLKHIKLIIIDEAFMVPIEMKKDIEKFGIKIIACGDWNQLPPVNSNPAYLVSRDVRLLTKVMRQAENSNIIKLAYSALNNIPISNGYYGDVLVIDENELTDQMILSSDIVICAKNSTREYYNNKIRKLYGFTGNIPQYGERIICRSNNKHEVVDDINLANGLIGSTVNFPDVSGFDGKTFSLLFKPDLLDNAFDIRASYKYFAASYQQRDALRNDRFLEGEKFEFAYAITAHLSQGSQFNNIIVIDEPMMGNINNRLLYVAITRARQRLIFVKKINLGRRVVMSKWTHKLGLPEPPTFIVKEKIIETVDLEPIITHVVEVKGETNLSVIPEKGENTMSKQEITKDAYHTMDELYDHRTVLFAIVCKKMKDSGRAWKSKRHYDGSSEDGWFIAGVETPFGQVTYHQKIEYWDMFDCPELDRAPFYDGHTPEQALERLKLYFFGDILD